MSNIWNWELQDTKTKDTKPTEGPLSRDKQFVPYTSQNKFKDDECYIKQNSHDNKSIFGYVTNAEMYVNKNRCFDSTPPFQNFIHSGKPQQNVDIENELFNITRNNTRCNSKKYQGDSNLTEQMSKKVLYNDNLCKPEFKILPNGYNGFF